MACLLFNGTTDLASSTVIPFLTFPATLFAWVKFATQVGTNTVVGGYANQASTHFAALAVNATGGVLGQTNGGGTTQQAQTGNVITTGAWFSIADVWRSLSDRSSYASGGNRADNTTAISAPQTFIRFSVGVRDSNTRANFFNGRIGALAIWAADIGDANIAALDKGISPRRIAPDKLIYFAPYLGIGSAILDWLGNNLTLTGCTPDPDGPPMEHP